MSFEPSWQNRMKTFIEAEHKKVRIWWCQENKFYSTNIFIQVSYFAASVDVIICLHLLLFCALRNISFSNCKIAAKQKPNYWVLTETIW